MGIEFDARTQVVLGRDTNQALGLGVFAVEFMQSGARLGGAGGPAASVVKRTNQFHVDSVLCGVSALALRTNAPTILRDEALRYGLARGGSGSMRLGGVPVFGSAQGCFVEKAVVANSAAVREWDSNGTNFGYNPRYGHVAGEFGHNDFYPVALAAAQQVGKDGAFALRGMILLDEIRGRLAEVFSLKTYKIDHVLHGAIASAATYGAMVGASPEQIEHAIGMVVAHHVPFRAIRYGKQLSDSKGASAAISTEAALVCVQRAMRGFIGPKDIFRNAEAVFCLLPGMSGKKVAKGESPFDLVLSKAGDDFAVMGMHFKLGLYEHQSAGAIQALLNLLGQNPGLLEDNGERIKGIKVVAYEPAYHIIGDPAKRDPRTRQSADHSMVYILSTLLRKAIERKSSDWATLMLMPQDYSEQAVFNSFTRRLMERVEFAHGGASYDEKYPEGIPTSVVVSDDQGREYDSGLVMFPSGHARNTAGVLEKLLAHKFKLLGALASDDPAGLVKRFDGLEKKSAGDVQGMCDFTIAYKSAID
jgi:2-methylcitrate dehydratase